MLFCSHRADALIHAGDRRDSASRARTLGCHGGGGGGDQTRVLPVAGRRLCGHEDSLTPQCDIDIFFKRADKSASRWFNLLLDLDAVLTAWLNFLRVLHEAVRDDGTGALPLIFSTFSSRCWSHREANQILEAVCFSVECYVSQVKVLKM